MKAAKHIKTRYELTDITLEEINTIENALLTVESKYEMEMSIATIQSHVIKEQLETTKKLLTEIQKARTVPVSST